MKRKITTPRGVVPDGTIALTAMVDAQLDCLYASVMSWDISRGGTVIDYMVWPPQKTRTFSLAKIKTRASLASYYPTLTADEAIAQGTADFMSFIESRTYAEADGTEHQIKHGGVDIGFRGLYIERGMVASGLRHWIPMRGVGGGTVSIAEWGKNKKLMRRFGDHWCYTLPKHGQFKIMRILHEPDHWKTELYTSLAVPEISDAAIKFYDHSSPSHHKELCEHLTSETAAPDRKGGTVYDKWTLEGNQDNHLLDTTVGNLILASFCGIKKGIKRDEQQQSRPQPKRRGRRPRR